MPIQSMASGSFGLVIRSFNLKVGLGSVRSKWLFYSGLIMMVHFSFILHENFKVAEVHKRGDVITLEILDKSRSCEGTRNKYFEVSYLNKIYSIRVNGHYCKKYQKGELIKLKHLPGFDRFVLAEDSVNDDLFFNIALIITFGTIAIVGFVKKSRDTRN